MNYHTYFIGETKNDDDGYTLAHTSHLKNNPKLVEGLIIVKILQTNSYKKASVAFEEYIQEHIKKLE